MPKQVSKWLYDILTAIEEIESYFDENPKDFDYFSSNGMLKRAIERNLEIIGEAVNRILKVAPNTEITNARNIVGLRNQIIHAYDNIQDEIIWGIVIKNIPSLKEEIKLLIKNE